MDCTDCSCIAGQESSIEEQPCAIGHRCSWFHSGCIHDLRLHESRGDFAHLNKANDLSDMVKEG